MPLYRHYKFYNFSIARVRAFICTSWVKCSVASDNLKLWTKICLFVHHLSFNCLKLRIRRLCRSSLFHNPSQWIGFLWKYFKDTPGQSQTQPPWLCCSTVGNISSTFSKLLWLNPVHLCLFKASDILHKYNIYFCLFWNSSASQVSYSYFVFLSFFTKVLHQSLNESTKKTNYKSMTVKKLKIKVMPS